MLKRFARNEKGQAMVEFALITPLLILLLCGIIDFGWIFGNQLILNNAARDTARYMAINYDNTPITGTTLAEKQAAAETTFANRLGAYDYLSDEDLSVILTPPAATGERNIIIDASYPLPFLTPLIPTILPGDWDFITIDAETTMRIE